MSTMKSLIAASILAAGCSILVHGAAAQGEQGAAGGHEEADLKLKSWPHSGPFGKFDKAAAQRGFQVYREVCSGCHSLNFVAFRNLEALGFSEEEVKALAEEYEVTDGPDDNGDMFQRPGKPSDKLPAPFENENAARASNGGALPPDLSLITKAREDGTNYVYSLLQGYEEPPADVEVAEGMNYNVYFPGHQIAMVQPLDEGAVEYGDGTEASLEQLASDVSTFLTWTAEPKLEERKGTGLKAMIFLVILSGLLYATKRKVWSDVH